MGQEIDYYFAPISGYAYLGHQALMRVAAEAGATVNFLPDTTPPFAQSDVRKSYRIADQARWAAQYDLPMAAVPKHWPTDPVPSCKAILATAAVGADQDAASFACLKAVWADDRNIADYGDLSAALSDAGLPAAEILEAANAPEIGAQVDAITAKAITAEVFGSPTYVVNGQRFWGQDRLAFLAAALS